MDTPTVPRTELSWFNVPCATAGCLLVYQASMSYAEKSIEIETRISVLYCLGICQYNISSVIKTQMCINFSTTERLN